MRIPAFLSVVLTCAGSVAQAQSVEDIVRLSVVPGWDTGRGTRMAGLRIDLAPGWKTYWRAPGDAGIPPVFSFTGDNLSHVSLNWPAPEVFDQNGVRSVGYAGSVVLPLEIATPDGDAPSRLAGQIDMGVCEEICVPVSVSFEAALPADGPRTGSIVAALLDQPVAAQEAGIPQPVCTIRPTADGVQMITRIAAPGDTRDVVVEAGDPLVWVSEPDLSRAGGLLTATVDMVHMQGGGFALDRSAVRITLLGGSQAVDIRGCVAP